MPSSKTPDLDIVIVNWNAGALLDRCLKSIAASEGRDQFLSRIILVDNASSDGSTEGLERHGLPLELLRQRENLGYGRAADLGARAAEATFLLFLNPDVRLKGDSLRRSLERLTALEESLARPPAILG
ncbi:MAG: glycosyltransferase, partial [Limibacillus sp.]